MKRLTEQYNGEWVTEHAEEMDYFLIKGKAIDRLAAYEDSELTPEQVATLKAENEMLKSLTSDIPLERLEEICKAEKENRLITLPKCPQCGLVNAWSIGKKYCDRCGANLNGCDV